MADSFAMHVFNMTYMPTMTYWPHDDSDIINLMEDKTMCETKQIAHIFKWLEDEARIWFPDPTLLSGITGPNRFQWQPPNYLQYLEQRNQAEAYYVGHKTIHIQGMEVVREGHLDHVWGPLHINRMCIRQVETVQVIKLCPHPGTEHSRAHQ